MYILAVQTAKGTADVGNRKTLEATTESQATLKAIEEALGRMKSPARITIWLDSQYVGGAILQHWPEKWEESGWKTAKGEPVRDAELWASVLVRIRPHEVSVKMKQHHEYREWMRRELEKMKVAPAQQKGESNV